MLNKIASTFIIKVIIALLNLAIVIMLSRFIGAAGKGEASIIITSIAMILLFCNMLGGAPLVYLISRYNPLILFFISNVWSVMVCVIAYYLCTIFNLIDKSFVIHIILLSAINSFLTTNLSILLGKEKIMSHNYVSLLQTVINLFILWLMIKGFNQVNISAYINSLYIAMGICFIVSTVLILPDLKNNSPNNREKSFAALVKFGLINQAGHIMKFMSFRISYYAMAYFSGNATLGIYSNGVALIESLLLVSNSFSTILYPKVSNNDNIYDNQQLTLQMTKASTLICVLFLLPLILLPSEFWAWLFGNEFNGVHEVILLLAPGILLYNMALIIGHYFSGIGKYYINTLANFAGLILTTGLILLSGSNYGLKEASIISTLSYLITTAVIVAYFVKDAKIPYLEILPRFSDLERMKFHIKDFFGK